MIQMGMRLLREYQGEDDRTVALLNARAPFLKESRLAKLDGRCRSPGWPG